MSDLPLVSYIVRTVNRPLYLRECLQSINIQTYPNIEVVLVNDGGPSIREYAEQVCPLPQLRIIENLHPLGRSNSANQGLEAASGNYVGFIDDDDVFYPWHTSDLVEQLERNHFRAVYADALRATQIVCPFDSRRYMTTGLELCYSKDYSREEILKTNFIPILCVLFERQLLDERQDLPAVRMDPMLHVLEDWDFWIKLGAVTDLVHLKKITCEYRARIDGSNTVGQLNHVWEWSRQCIDRRYQEEREQYLKQEEGASVNV
ncbi:MAG: glycosyltransferase family A protein [bacterium]|nr:glycosyltransferase family A protein [bacterium]